jgi:predicted house-cleaning noncanonical NTP pyrophosphatase (MazG superfamily)
MKFKHFETNLKKENEYPKLVRDKIPEVIEKRTGKKPEIRIMKVAECKKYLLKKVEEEAHELANAKDRRHVVEEIADVMEVIDTILALNKLELKTVRKVQKEKFKERGGFRKKILMLGKV